MDRDPAGTDGLLVLALVHELLKAGRVDLDYLIHYSNAPVLIVHEPGSADDGLILRNRQGEPLAFDRVAARAVEAGAAGIAPALTGRYVVEGRTCVPVLGLIAERYLDEAYSPDAVERRCGVPAATIRRIAAELAQVAFGLRSMDHLGRGGRRRVFLTEPLRSILVKGLR